MDSPAVTCTFSVVHHPLTFMFTVVVYTAWKTYELIKILTSLLVLGEVSYYLLEWPASNVHSRPRYRHFRHALRSDAKTSKLSRHIESSSVKEVASSRIHSSHIFRGLPLERLP